MAYCQREYDKTVRPPIVWTVSDTHFDHLNIIKYGCRPFKNVIEMNYTMISNWNRVVGRNDIVLFLGDLAFSAPPFKLDWLHRLNGIKRIILGNHDAGLYGTDCLLVRYNGMKVLMVHDPYKLPITWNGWVIHGHIHNNGPLFDFENKRVNVCVEATNYTPVMLKSIIEIIIKNSN